MTDPTLDEAIDKLVMFAGVPDPFGWSLDGENFDLGALVVVVQSQVAAVQHEAWETKQRLKTAEAALDVARASVDELAHVANGLELDVKRWRDQCLVTADHVKAAAATPMQALAWATAHGWEESLVQALTKRDDARDEAKRWPDGDGWGLMRLRAPGSFSECDAVIYETHAHGPVELGIAGLCNESARELDTPCAHDILAEMAALEVPT